MQSGPLCTPEDIDAASDIDLSPWADAVSGLIAAASQAICDFAGREFAPASSDSATRVFIVPEFPDWPRVVSVGDLGSITTLKVADYTATVDEYTLYPLNRGPGEPITEIGIGASLPFYTGARVEVTGVWGWPQVPEVARMAAVDTVRSWLKGGWIPNVSTGQDDSGVASGISLTAMRLLRPYRDVPVA